MPNQMLVHSEGTCIFCLIVQSAMDKLDTAESRGSAPGIPVTLLSLPFHYLFPRSRRGTK